MGVRTIECTLLDILYGLFLLSNKSLLGDKCVCSYCIYYNKSPGLPSQLRVWYINNTYLYRISSNRAPWGCTFFDVKLFSAILCTKH